MSHTVELLDDLGAIVQVRMKCLFRNSVLLYGRGPKISASSRSFPKYSATRYISTMIQNTNVTFLDFLATLDPGNILLISDSFSVRCSSGWTPLTDSRPVSGLGGAGISSSTMSETSLHSEMAEVGSGICCALLESIVLTVFKRWYTYSGSSNSIYLMNFMNAFLVTILDDFFYIRNALRRFPKIFY